MDNLVADTVEGAQGALAVSLVPHCQPNGTVTVSQDEYAIAVVSPGQSDGSGIFSPASSLSYLHGVGGPLAQERIPETDGYIRAPAAEGFSDPTKRFPGGLDATLCWPAVGQPDGIADGDLIGDGYTLSHTNCVHWP